MSKRFSMQDIERSSCASLNKAILTGKGEIPHYRFYIGIDAGVNTGFAVWDKVDKKFAEIATYTILQAMARVKVWYDNPTLQNKIFVRVEDARKVKYKTDPVKSQGAGSVKRDCSIWEEFLTGLGMAFEMPRPNKAITKWDAIQFKKYTGYTGLTSKHARDAAMLVFNYSYTFLKAK